MKTIETEVVTKHTYYICEVCQHEYLIEKFAMQCEKNHGCRHMQTLLDFNDFSEIGRSEIHLMKVCEHCEEILECVELILDSKTIELLMNNAKDNENANNNP